MLRDRSLFTYCEIPFVECRIDILVSRYAGIVPRASSRVSPARNRRVRSRWTIVRCSIGNVRANVRLRNSLDVGCVDGEMIVWSIFGDRWQGILVSTGVGVYAGELG